MPKFVKDSFSLKKIDRYTKNIMTIIPSLLRTYWQSLDLLKSELEFNSEQTPSHWKWKNQRHTIYENYDNSLKVTS